MCFFAGVGRIFSSLHQELEIRLILRDDPFMKFSTTQDERKTTIHILTIPQKNPVKKSLLPKKLNLNRIPFQEKK